MRKVNRWIALGISFAAAAGCSAEPETAAQPEDPAETEVVVEVPAQPEPQTEARRAAPPRTADEVAADPEFQAEARRQAEAAAAAAERVMARIESCQQEIGACEANSQGLELVQCVNEAYTSLGVWWKEAGDPLANLSAAQRSEILLAMQALESRVHGIKSQFAAAR